MTKWYSVTVGNFQLSAAEFGLTLVLGFGFTLGLKS